MPIFPKNLEINSKDLKLLGFEYVNTEAILKENNISKRAESEYGCKEIYIHKLVNKGSSQSVILNLYSVDKKFDEELRFFRILFLFNQ